MEFYNIYPLKPRSLGLCPVVNIYAPECPCELHYGHGDVHRFETDAVVFSGVFDRPFLYGVKLRRTNVAKYRLRHADYEQMLIDQNGRCKLCAEAPNARPPSRSFKKLVVDHCHDSGLVRGLLCDWCNLVLGKLEESVKNTFTASQAHGLVWYLLQSSSGFRRVEDEGKLVVVNTFSAAQADT